MGLLILAFPILEIWGLFFFGARIGFVNTLFWLIAAGVLGLGLIRAQGAFLIGNFQSAIAKGQVPTKQIVHSLVIFVAGALFIVPGFFSDLIALLLILPGTRHLFVNLASKYLQKQMKKGKFRMASFGGFGAGGFGAGGFAGGFGGGFGSAGPSASRDVTPRELTGEASEASGEVIDVIPINRASKRTDKKNND